LKTLHLLATPTYPTDNNPFLPLVDDGNTVNEKLDLGISCETQNLGDVNSNSVKKGESDDLK
jgi:hypothetical protein